MRFLGKDFVMSFLERTNKRCEKIKNLSYFIFPPPPPPTSKEKKTSNHIFFSVFVAVCVRGIWLIENTFIIITIMVRAAASEFSFFFGLGKFEKC